MRLLCFQAKRFAWKPFERTLPDAADAGAAIEVRGAVIAFVHVEQTDTQPARVDSVFRQAVKQLENSGHRERRGGSARQRNTHREVLSL